VIEFLVAVATDSIASRATLAYLDRATLTADQVIARRKEYEALPPTAAFVDKLNLGERFMYLDCVQLVRRGGAGMLEGLAGGRIEKPDESQLKALARIDWEPALRDGNAWYDRMAAAARKPTRGERIKAFAEIERDVKELKRKTVGEDNDVGAVAQAMVGNPGKEAGQAIGNVLVGLLVPASEKVMTAADRAEQTQRNLRVAFALEAFRKTTGGYPKRLDELTVRYIRSVPDDLFTGKPLVYKLEGKGYRLYSVGPNGTDDGGRSFDDDPPGDDLVVRMPIPTPKK
jgi:hypothetical protein